jgi:hypothetical protein
METTTKEQGMSPVVAKTLRNAFRVAQKTGETLYIVATYNGPRIVKTQPTFQSYYKVEAGDVTHIAYEPWNA